MKIKTKLTSGIGLLFMIIVLLGVLAISYIDKLADDTKNILSDNYNSLDYAKGMLYALDNLETGSVEYIHGEPRKTETEYHGNQRVGSHRPLGPPFQIAGRES